MVSFQDIPDEDIGHDEKIELINWDFPLFVALYFLPLSVSFTILFLHYYCIMCI